VLVGLETGDDAGVVRIDAAQAVVTTADFITPPLDDPERYGRIAAANSLSDVYAMGGTPICAINLCLFPRELAPESAREILAGAHAVLVEVGVPLVGGHTVHAQELFFGLSVTGLVAPQRLWRNVGAQPGDVLLLTKPLGTGLFVTGMRRRLAGTVFSAAEQAACIAGMAATNARAAQVLRRFDVHAATDVTGFGLVGHALGMTRGTAPRVRLCIDVARLPLYAGALALGQAGVTCGGAKNNRAAYRAQLAIHGSLDPAHEEILFDPQTSGGLLVALPAEQAEPAAAALREAGGSAHAIGEVEAADAGPPLSIRA
jgi:selenide,water dikinase